MQCSAGVGHGFAPRLHGHPQSSPRTRRATWTSGNRGMLLVDPTAMTHRVAGFLRALPTTANGKDSREAFCM